MHLIHVFLTEEEAYQVCERLSDLLGQPIKYVDDYYFVKGHLGNILVYSNPRFCTFKGSIQKWFLGANDGVFTFQDSVKALNCFSATVGLELERMRVSRADIGVNIETGKAPEEYYQYLDHCPGFSRLPQEDSLLYKNKTKTKSKVGEKEFHIYDKNDESGKEAGFTPYKMRIEARFTKHSVLKEVLKCNFVTAKDLTEPETCMKLLNYFQQLYLKIYKTIRMSFKEPFNGGKELDKLLAAAALHLLYPSLDLALKDLKMKYYETGNDHQVWQRMRKQIIERYTYPLTLQENPHEKELTGKFSELCQSLKI